MGLPPPLICDRSFIHVHDACQWGGGGGGGSPDVFEMCLHWASSFLTLGGPQDPHSFLSIVCTRRYVTYHGDLGCHDSVLLAYQFLLFASPLPRLVCH